ncbi:LppW family protein [Geodermatophilus sp. URMC 64]
MAPGPRLAGRRVRRGVCALLAGSLAGIVLLGCVDSSSPMSAVSAVAPAGDIEPAVPDRLDRRPLPPPPAPVDDAAVLARVQEAATAAGGSIAVVVEDAYERELLAGPDAGRPLLTASLIKPLVVAELLERQQTGALALAPGDLDLMARASTASDDGAMSTLWVRHDGAALVTAAATRLGLTGTAPPARVGQWGEATATAADLATFLSRLDDVYGEEVAATLIGWLQGTTPRAADGFDQLFGLLSPAAGAAGPVAAKQGWMCCVGGRRQLHSAGVLADGRVVVLLGDFPAGTSWRAAAAALDAAAAAVVSGTAPPPRPTGP